MSQTRQIYCPNGSLKDPSQKNISCPAANNDCFTGSYDYCKPLTTTQIVILVAVCIGCLALTGLVVKLLWSIPILNWVITACMLIATGVGIYFIYEHYRTGGNKD